MFLFTFFSTVAHFHPGGASISDFLDAATKFNAVLPSKNVSFVFFYLALALFLVELRWPVALLSLFLRLSLCLFSEFVDRTINLNLIL